MSAEILSRERQIVNQDAVKVSCVDLNSLSFGLAKILLLSERKIVSANYHNEAYFHLEFEQVSLASREHSLWGLSRSV